MIYDEREPLTPSEIRETLEKLTFITKKLHEMIDVVNAKTQALHEMDMTLADNMATMSRALLDITSLVEEVAIGKSANPS